MTSFSKFRRCVRSLLAAGLAQLIPHSRPSSTRKRSSVKAATDYLASSEGFLRRHPQRARGRAHDRTQCPGRPCDEAAAAAARQAAVRASRRVRCAGLRVRRQGAGDPPPPGADPRHACPASETIDQALAVAREQLDIIVPAGELIASNAITIAFWRTSPRVRVGKVTVGGMPCIHLRFRATNVDWQIWIQEGPQPLPRKLLITTPGAARASQSVVEFLNWNLAPEFAGRRVAIAPQKGGQRVEFLPPTPAGATGQAAGSTAGGLQTLAGRWCRVPEMRPSLLSAGVPRHERRLPGPGQALTNQLARSRAGASSSAGAPSGTPSGPPGCGGCAG